MPNLPSEQIFSSFTLATLAFSQPNVAASQTSVALDVNQSTAAGLGVTDVIAPWAGSIVGIAVRANANITAQTNTWKPTINGVELANTVGLNVSIATSAAKAYATILAQVSGARFNAGDVLGVKVTTDGTHAPTTVDVQVILFVVYEAIQP